ncbi:MAG: hypothetical protein NVSMB56_04250 [Pyrinomonadaceae bacterium]
MHQPTLLHRAGIAAVTMIRMIKVASGAACVRENQGAMKWAAYANADGLFPPNVVVIALMTL